MGKRMRITSDKNLTDHGIEFHSLEFIMGREFCLDSYLCKFVQSVVRQVM